VKAVRITAAVVLLAAVWAAAAQSAAASRPPARWVAVSVATLWSEPGDDRRVDAPSVANPADPRAWVEAMTDLQKRWLVGRLQTQALYGSKVYLLATSGRWSKVAVAGQPTPKNRWGYPGWVPTRQLAVSPPPAGDFTAVVMRPAAWVYDDAALGGRVLELSYGTRLPVLDRTPDRVEVALLDGRSAFVRRSAAALHATGAPRPAPTGAMLVAEARRFLGLEYLWGGTSGFGFDCSGLTHAVLRALGVTIPRDGAPQSRTGVRVASRRALRAGDLVFFRGASGAIHHVGLYIGDGRMIHAPRTGSRVTATSILREPYASEFAGGRRFTP